MWRFQADSTIMEINGTERSHKEISNIKHVSSFKKTYLLDYIRNCIQFFCIHIIFSFSGMFKIKGLKIMICFIKKIIETEKEWKREIENSECFTLSKTDVIEKKRLKWLCWSIKKDVDALMWIWCAESCFQAFIDAIEIRKA